MYLSLKNVRILQNFTPKPAGSRISGSLDFRNSLGSISTPIKNFEQMYLSLKNVRILQNFTPKPTGSRISGNLDLGSDKTRIRTDG